MRELIARLTRLLNPRAARIREAEALVGRPVRVREESHLFGSPRITTETIGFVQSVDQRTGELLVSFTTEVLGQRVYLYLFPNEILLEEAVHV